MKLTYHQRPLLKPVVFCVLAVSFFMLAYIQLDEMETNMQSQLNAEQGQVESLYQEVNSALEKINIVQRYDERFKKLVDKGIIGSQSRADWIDRLMEGINMYGIVHANLQFSQRKPISASQLDGFVNPQLVQIEQITFEGVFQHEDDFIHFMSYVKNNVHELTLVHGCSMMLTSAGEKNAANGFVFNATDGNMLARCQFSFVEVAREVSVSNTK
jgi:hypothetical protein